MLLRVALAMTDAAARKGVEQALQGTDTTVETLEGGRDVLKRAVAMACDVLLIDQDRLAGALRGGVLIAPNVLEMPTVVAMSPDSSPQQRAQLVASGCDAVLHAALPAEPLRQALRTILDKRRARVAASLARRPIAKPRLADFVSDSPVMGEFMATVYRVVAGSSSLLILGETGTGKERLARAIHAEGPRANGPFIAVNCGALPEALLESDLFGHEEGAFTGATRARRGAFELAHGGTIFLDEVGDMPVHLQVKLLRVLQDRQVQRVGGEKPFDVDVRVMAASNRDLAGETEQGRFRKDLYYRLSVVTLEVPPLRRRKEDIPALARSYVDFHRSRIGREVHHVDEPVIDVLCRYNWPGNIRELINVIERAMLLCRADTITLADLPAGITGFAPRRSAGLWIPADPTEVPSAWLAKPLKELRDSVLAELERTYLAAMLAATGGKVGETAQRAGMEPRSLYDKMKQYGLAKEDFRPGRPKPAAR